MGELRYGEVSVLGSFSVGELQCWVGAVWGSCRGGVLRCGGVAI